MAKMSDRERLERLAQEKERARQESLAKEQQRQTEESKRQADLLTQDQQKTEEVLQYCKQQFEGFKLVPTGHEVRVGTAGSSRTLGIQADRVDFVSFNISHWGEETNDFQGQIAVLLTRFRNGEYHVIDADCAKSTLKTFDQLKEKLVQMLSEMDREYLKRVFEQVRRHFPGR
jgi:hypothetical protein